MSDTVPTASPDDTPDAAAVGRRTFFSGKLFGRVQEEPVSTREFATAPAESLWVL